MSMQTLVNAMSPEIYQRLLQAVETGKWPDGTVLNEEQRENSLQAVMLYQAKVLKSDEHMSIGEDGQIVQKSRQQLKQDMAQQAYNSNPIMRFNSDDI
ncbi:YeaC family protein [Neptunicella sp.]|uniref:YeaC family protein n=1 Tax=Neptunicella sp. TaxID=2125986 RepID=UPI003F68DB64